MTGPIVIRLVGAAVALGLPGDPDVFGSMLARDWIAARAKGRGR